MLVCFKCCNCHIFVNFFCAISERHLKTCNLETDAIFNADFVFN